MTTATIPQRTLTLAVRQFLADQLGQQIDTELTTTDLNFVLDQVRRTDERVESVQQEEQKILTNRETSDEGKSKALAALADRSVGSFSYLERVIARHEKEIGDVEAKLYARLSPPTTEDSNARLIRELRASELRASVESAPHDATFLAALDKNDFETVWALLTAPGGSWVNDEVLERGKVEYAKRTDPASLAGMKSLSIVRDRIAGILDFVRSWLSRLGASEATVLKHLG